MPYELQVASGPIAVACWQPSLVRHTELHRARRIYGLTPVNTTRPHKLPFRTPSWVRAPLPAFTGPVGLHTYRQGAKLSQHSAACSILDASRGPRPCRPRDQQGAIPQHHRLHRCPPGRRRYLAHPHAQEVPRSNLLTELGSRIAPKFGIFWSTSLSRVLD